MTKQQARERAQHFADFHSRPVEVILHRAEGYMVGKYADGFADADIPRIQNRPGLAQVVCIMQPRQAITQEA